MNKIYLTKMSRLHKIPNSEWSIPISRRTHRQYNKRLPFLFCDETKIILAREYPGVCDEVYEEIHRSRKYNQLNSIEKIYQIGLKARRIGYKKPIFYTREYNIEYGFTTMHYYSIKEAEQIIDRELSAYNTRSMLLYIAEKMSSRLFDKHLIKVIAGYL